MRRVILTLCVLALLPLTAGFAFAQEKPFYQSDFSKEDFAERRAKLFEKIGKNAIAVVQGAKGTADFNVFRQTNEFYYLTGVETPHAYLVLDGRNQRTTLYLSHRDADRERNEGRLLTAEDEALIKEMTGIDAVRPIETLSLDLPSREGAKEAKVGKAFFPSRPSLLRGKFPNHTITASSWSRSRFSGAQHAPSSSGCADRYAAAARKVVH